MKWCYPHFILAAQVILNRKYSNSGQFLLSNEEGESEVQRHLLEQMITTAPAHASGASVWYAGRIDGFGFLKNLEGD